jgi:hypothetical protein
MKIIYLLGLLLFLAACENKQLTNENAINNQLSKAFIDKLNNFCDKELIGEIIYPVTTGHQLAGADTKIKVQGCESSSVTINFFLNQINTLDWNFYFDDQQNLRLKIIHNDTTGLPEGLSSYEGRLYDQGTEVKQSFIPTIETIDSLPQTLNNVWNFEYNDEYGTLKYTLQRGNELRFQAIYKVHPDK